MEHLKLVKVPTYGTVVLRNTATQGLLIAPMHIGFFQDDAQNHATSRVLLIEAGELLEANDCFCIQQSQGGSGDLGEHAPAPERMVGGEEVGCL